MIVFSATTYAQKRPLEKHTTNELLQELNDNLSNSTNYNYKYILEILDRKENDSVKAIAYHCLSYYHFYNSGVTDSAISNMVKSVSYATRDGNSYQLKNNYLCLSEFYALKSDSKKALFYLEKAKDIKESNKTDFNSVNESSTRIGSIYAIMGDFKNSIRFEKNYNRKIDLCLEQNPQLTKIQKRILIAKKVYNYINLGNSYTYLKQLVDCTQKVRQIYN